MKSNVFGLIASIALALSGYFLSEAFVAESFGLSEQTAGTIKLLSTIVGIVLTAYNGYQINAKSKVE